MNKHYKFDSSAQKLSIYRATLISYKRSCELHHT